VKSRNIKIMKTTPEFTDAEIHEMMDFKQVLALTEAAQRRSRKIIRSIITTVLITGLVGGGVFVYNEFSSSEPGASSPTTANPSPAATVAPDSTMHSAAIPDSAEKEKKLPLQKPPIAEKKNANPKTPSEKPKETVSPTRVDSAKSVSVFQPAEPVDGYPALYEYFAKELRYPEEAIKDSIQGVISVTFIINTQGTPEQVVTNHLLGDAFEKEAIRVIEHMPVWKPAQLDGTPVKSKVSVPITFSLKTVRQ
jgi:protein TonB